MISLPVQTTPGPIRPSMGALGRARHTGGGPPLVPVGVGVAVGFGAELDGVVDGTPDPPHAENNRRAKSEAPHTHIRLIPPG